MHRVGRIALQVGAALLAGGLDAAAVSARDFPGRLSPWVAPENPKCTCRYRGEHLPLGARRCLQTPLGARTAECVTNQNMTSWQPTDEPCAQS